MCSNISYTYQQHSLDSNLALGTREATYMSSKDSIDRSSCVDAASHARIV